MQQQIWIKLFSSLEKIKGKSLGQNPDNLKHFLLKDFDYESEDAKNLIKEAMVENVIKSMIFNGKVACRIVRADSAADDAIIIPETQEVDFHDEKNNATVTAEDTQVSPEHHHSSNGNISAILKKFRSSLEAIDQRF